MSQHIPENQTWWYNHYTRGVGLNLEDMLSQPPRSNLYKNDLCTAISKILIAICNLCWLLYRKEKHLWKYCRQVLPRTYWLHTLFLLKYSFKHCTGLLKNKYTLSKICFTKTTDAKSLSCVRMKRKSLNVLISMIWSGASLRLWLLLPVTCCDECGKSWIIDLTSAALHVGLTSSVKITLRVLPSVYI
jgi:hypothetical protein